VIEELRPQVAGVIMPSGVPSCSMVRFIRSGVLALGVLVAAWILKEQGVFAHLLPEDGSPEVWIPNERQVAKTSLARKIPKLSSAPGLVQFSNRHGSYEPVAPAWL
jgi:hypothetical protein